MVAGGHLEQGDQVQVRVHAHVKELQRKGAEQKQLRTLVLIVVGLLAGMAGIGFVLLRM